MSDIGLDGLESYLIALCLGGLFLLGVAVLLLLSWWRVRRRKEPFTKTPYFPHLLGLLLCSLGVGFILLFLEKGYLFFQDPSGFSPDYLIVPKWLDGHVWLWVPFLATLWPLGFFILKFLKRSQKKEPRPTE